MRGERELLAASCDSYSSIFSGGRALLAWVSWSIDVMRLQRGGVLAAMVVVAVSTSAASAAPNVTCQSSTVTVFGPNQPSANAQWEKRVGVQLGKAWSSLSNAQGYKMHRDSLLPSPNAVQVSAIPCEVLPPTQAPNVHQPAPP